MFVADVRVNFPKGSFSFGLMVKTLVSPVGDQGSDPACDNGAQRGVASGEEAHGLVMR